MCGISPRTWRRSWGPDCWARVGVGLPAPGRRPQPEPVILASASGVVAGLLHVASGPDHLTAIAPLAASRHRRALSAGVRWGLGHSAGVALVAVAALAVRGALPLQSLSTWGERLVGVVLIGVGAWSLRQAARARLHSHRHEHDGVTHEHWHWHAPKPEHQARAAHGHGHAALGIGTLHGLAGSSHLAGVLPTLAFQTTAESLAYLGGFAAGTVAAMGLFAGLVGLLAGRLNCDGDSALRRLMAGCGVAAIGVGGWWLAAGGG